MKMWVVYFSLFGYAAPVSDDVEFTTESACVVYLAHAYREQIRKSFKLHCGVR